MKPIDTAVKAAYEAGFRGEPLVIAVAIAGAESSYNPAAVGDVYLQTNKWGPSLGLWQIRTLTRDYVHMEPIRAPEGLNDPYQNARAAFQISKSGTNFNPWSTYLDNKYQAYLEQARLAVDGFMNTSGPLMAEVKKKPSPHCL